MKKILSIVLLIVSIAVISVPITEAYDLCNVEDTLKVLPIQISFEGLKTTIDGVEIKTSETREKVVAACEWWEKSSNGELDFCVYDTVYMTISKGEYSTEADIIATIDNYAYYDLIIISYVNGNILKKSWVLGYSSSFGLSYTNLETERNTSVRFCAINPNVTLNVYIHEMGHAIGFHNELYNFMTEPDWMVEDYPNWIKRDIFGWNFDVNVIGQNGSKRTIEENMTIWIVDMNDGKILDLNTFILDVATPEIVLREAVGIEGKDTMYDVNLDGDITVADARICLRIEIGTI